MFTFTWSVCALILSLSHPCHPLPCLILSLSPCPTPGGSGDLGVREPDHHQVEPRHLGLQGELEIQNRQANA